VPWTTVREERNIRVKGGKPLRVLAQRGAPDPRRGQNFQQPPSGADGRAQPLRRARVPMSTPASSFSPDSTKIVHTS